jgi:hypothetical protein
VEETDLELEELFTEQEDDDEADGSSQLDAHRAFFRAVASQRHNSTNDKRTPPRKRRASLVSRSVVSGLSAVSATSVVDEFWADQLTSDFFNDDDETSSAVAAALTAEEEEFNTSRTPLQLVSAATHDDPSISADRGPPPFGLRAIAVPRERH